MLKENNILKTLFENLRENNLKPFLETYTFFLILSKGKFKYDRKSISSFEPFRYVCICKSLVSYSNSGIYTHIYLSLYSLYNLLSN